jgi:hypothetical protein
MSHIVLSGEGPACPRCGRPMQIREHDRIRPKQLRKAYYYRRWFYCAHKDQNDNGDVSRIQSFQQRSRTSTPGNPATAATTRLTHLLRAMSISTDSIFSAGDHL